MRLCLFLLLLVGSVAATAQRSIIRGNVYDRDSGEPIALGTVTIEGTTIGASTDFDGFFTLSNLAAGTYEIVTTYVGYDTARATVTLDGEGIRYVKLTIGEGVNLAAVEVSAARTQARTEVQVSQVTLTTRDLKTLPSTGGDADLAQYLPVLPGIVTTGDQGGQIYIRGGSPVQNLIMLDGVTIFNPFHTIGFFSVFETEAIRNVEVNTGGFGAQNGGRLSAVVDINTKVGNRKKFSGLVGASPFQARALVEGPLKPYREGNDGSVSYLLTAKQGYLDRTSPQLYSYAADGELPYGYTDLYGKISTLSANGSSAEFFGFNFRDQARFPAVDYNWNTVGAGLNFKLVPPASNLILDGSLSFSNYESGLGIENQEPRASALRNILAKFNFSSFIGRNTFRYGFAFNGIRTSLDFVNGFGNRTSLDNTNAEIAAYFTYKRAWDAIVFEPGMRLQYYASQGEVFPEPRLGLKWNVADGLRVKAAGGLYSQNLLTSVSETDVVNLFVGFIGGPEQQVPGFDGRPLESRLQTAWHAIGGVEIDLARGIQLNVEPYVKEFTQLLSVNRNKRTASESDYQVETGQAVGLDFSLAYDRDRLYVWTTYSLARVTRDDGQQVYPTIFDRRHNVNFLSSYELDADGTLVTSLRYNFGTGFPFTATRGFYTSQRLGDGLNTDVTTSNPELGILFSPTRNGNRLPNYHRVDASITKTFDLKGDLALELNASVTNLSNRDNIFFVDRLNGERVDQLPVLPSLAFNFRW